MFYWKEVEGEEEEEEEGAPSPCAAAPRVCGDPSSGEVPATPPKEGGAGRDPTGAMTRQDRVQIRLKRSPPASSTRVANSGAAKAGSSIFTDR